MTKFLLLVKAPLALPPSSLSGSLLYFMDYFIAIELHECGMEEKEGGFRPLRDRRSMFDAIGRFGDAKVASQVTEFRKLRGGEKEEEEELSFSMQLSIAAVA